MLNRLVIGTANWAKEYNGHKVPEKEQQLIMEYMKEVGIEWLDVATDYGTENIGKGEFCRIVKTDDFRKVPIYPLKRMSDCEVWLAHSFNRYSSIYDGSCIDIDDDYRGNLPYVEFPFSILNREMGPIVANNRIARSIFCKGKALKYFSPQECIDFVLMNPRIDKVIIGVDSADQLRENVAHLVKMEKFTHNEEVDTRKFERKDLCVD